MDVAIFFLGSPLCGSVRGIVSRERRERDRDRDRERDREKTGYEPFDLDASAYRPPSKGMRVPPSHNPSVLLLLLYYSQA